VLTEIPAKHCGEGISAYRMAESPLGQQCAFGAVASAYTPDGHCVCSARACVCVCVLQAWLGATVLSAMVMVQGRTVGQ